MWRFVFSERLTRFLAAATFSAFSLSSSAMFALQWEEEICCAQNNPSSHSGAQAFSSFDRGRRIYYKWHVVMDRGAAGYRTGFKMYTIASTSSRI